MSIYQARFWRNAYGRIDDLPSVVDAPDGVDMRTVVVIVLWGWIVAGLAWSVWAFI